VRIITWNLNHRTRKRSEIPTSIPHAILSLDSDVVVLTEYVEGPCHAAFCECLSAGGLQVQMITPSGKHNQVLIASRLTAGRGAIVPPSSLLNAASNWLHVHLAEQALEIVGVRVPYYESAKDWDPYWDWFETAVPPLLLTPTVIIGDLNCDPQRSCDPGLKGRGSKSVGWLVGKGWHWRDPIGLGSYTSVSGSIYRLDHALVSPTLEVTGSEYIQSANGYFFMKPGLSPLSDHAPLVLEIACRSKAPPATELNLANH
jgi:hypothetical protein